MKVVPRHGAYDFQDDPGHAAGFVQLEHDRGHVRLDAMRSWVVSGVHLFVVDPRRRFGGHGRARELLVIDRPVEQGVSERWQTLASALHRHSVRDGLSTLSNDERRIINLAYLEGHTNREIAAILGVSVSTVRRRLWVALDRLDRYLNRTAAWLSALFLVVVASTLGQSARLGRWVGSAAASADQVQRLSTALAAGAVAGVALGMVGLTSDTALPVKSPPAATAPLIRSPLVAVQPTTLNQPPSVSQGSIRQDGVRETTRSGNGGRGHQNNGCDGNPTSAPPPVPMGSATHHPADAPVTHPGAGGCKG